MTDERSMKQLLPEFDALRARFPAGFESSLVLPCLRRLQEDRGFVADTDIDLRFRFNLHRVSRGRALRGRSVPLNSQIHRTLPRYRHDKTDIQRATRARKIVRQSAHRAQRGSRGNGDLRPECRQRVALPRLPPPGEREATPAVQPRPGSGSLFFRSACLNGPFQEIQSSNLLARILILGSGIAEGDASGFCFSLLLLMLTRHRGAVHQFLSR
jgi:hypothetical protein